PPGRVPAQPDDAVLPLAALPRRPEAGDAAPPPPGPADARRRPGSLPAPQRPARPVLRPPGRPAPGPRGPAQRGGHPRRDEDAPARGPGRHGPRGPRNPGPAPLRATEPGRNRPGAGHHRVRGLPPPPPRPETPQRNPHQFARRPRRPLAMTAPRSDLDVVGKVADSFLARYRRGERPPLSEYTAQYPDLADEIRELFP